MRLYWILSPHEIVVCKLYLGRTDFCPAFCYEESYSHVSSLLDLLSDGAFSVGSESAIGTPNSSTSPGSP